jgi:hypothetical protein
LSAAKRKWDSNNLFGAAKPVPLWGITWSGHFRG